MRNLILGVAALVAVAAPGVAMAQTGYVDASYISSEVDDGGDADGYRVGGAVAFDAHALGVQLDADIGSLEADGGADADFWNVGGHVYTRNSTYLLGGFASYGNVDGGGDDADYWTVGAEGQYYLARTTLNAAISYSQADDADLDVTGVDVGVRHFITDNFALDGGVGYANADAGGGADADIIALNVGAEYQFDAYPVSIFGGYQRTDVDDFDLEGNSFTVGVRYNFGGTLFDRDRSGASLGRGAGAGRLLGIL